MNHLTPYYWLLGLAIVDLILSIVFLLLVISQFCP